MPTSTYEPIATFTFTSAAQEFTFTAIPQTYSDLFMVRTGATNATNQHDITWRANGDTGNNYAYCRVLAESGADAFTDSSGTTSSVNANQTGQSVSFTWLQIFNYSSTSMYKGSIIKTNCNAPTFTMASGSGTWKSTAAITSLTIREEQGTFSAGSVFTLYGILRA